MFAKYKFSGLLLTAIIFLAIVIYFVQPNQSNAPTVKDNFIWKVERRGMTAETKTHWEEKRAEAQAKIDKKENLVQSYLELGDFERSLGNLKEALTAYNNSLAIQDGAVIRSRIADIYAEAGDYASAEAYYRKSIEINSTSYIYWRKLTEFMYDKLPDRRGELKSIYLEAINKADRIQKVDVITAYARYLDNIGDYKQSLDQWEQALILAPDNESIKAEVEALKTKAAE